MILTWFILAILVGVYASNKGKSFLGYFFIAALRPGIKKKVHS